MLLDLHTHSIASDDSRASVEQYVRWVGVLRKKGHCIDGFVLTEHRQFNHDVDYSTLSEANEILILKGSELDTDCGHFLVYGVTKEITEQIDFSNVNMHAEDLVEICDHMGAIAIPAHPGRSGIGFAEYLAGGRKGFDTIEIVEGLNGSNRPGEGEKAQDLIKSKGYKSIGGSDAHIVSAIGTCMTRFTEDVKDESDLVNKLREGLFRPVRLEESKEQ